MIFMDIQAIPPAPGLIAVTFGTIRHKSESENHMSDGSSMDNDSVKV